MRIREFDPAHDAEFMRSCVLELQAIERGYDPRLPPGDEMVATYCATLLARCREWDGSILIAEEEGVPVGLLSMFTRVPATEPDEPPEPSALISDLVVVPAYRRRGIASALLREAEDHARSRGAPVLRLEVMAAHAAARRFYERQGWRDRVVEMEKPFPRSGGDA